MAAPNLLLHMLADYEQARVGGASAPVWAALAARFVDGSAFGPLAGNEAVHQVDLGDVDKRLGVEAMRSATRRAAAGGRAAGRDPARAADRQGAGQRTVAVNG